MWCVDFGQWESKQVSSTKHFLRCINRDQVTGICECVGFSAPILGGGHGWLQGQYGLATDQVISARLVTPNGDIVNVSDEENPDLFWALRGAGHNFGIVTEWEYRVHEVKNPKWSYQIFLFSGDKLGVLFDLVNEMIKTQPPEVTHWIYIVKVPEVDPDHVSCPSTRKCLILMQSSLSFGMPLSTMAITN